MCAGFDIYGKVGLKSVQKSIYFQFSQLFLSPGPAEARGQEEVRGARVPAQEEEAWQ